MAFASRGAESIGVGPSTNRTNSSMGLPPAKEYLTRATR